MRKSDVRRLYYAQETPVGCRIPPAGLPPEIWRTLVRKAARNYTAARWQLGDLLCYGESAGYGGTYDKAIAEAGLSYKTVANVKWVSSRFEISRRRENLSFGHHAEVAALPDDQQDRLLDLAGKAGWSRSTLREEVAKTRSPEQCNVSGVDVERLPSAQEHLDEQPVPDEMTRRVGIEVTTTSIPLGSVSTMVASRALSPNSKAVREALEKLKPLLRPTTSPLVEALAVEHRVLESCAARLAAVDAEAAAAVRHALEVVVRRMAAVENEATVPNQQPARGHLH
jgi:hypothetical protein